MFKFCSLFSGSSGNSSLIQTENTKILVDVGVSSKKITESLENLEIDPNTIDAILITHEHSDHTAGISIFSNKYDIPVYANKETWNALKIQKEKIHEKNICYFDFTDFSIKDLTISPFSIPHDAANPCGFNIFKGEQKISIATDIGHITTDILDKLSNSSFILLESNYDLNILKCSKYPFLLKKRIYGENGHLSNDEAGKTISYLASHGVHNVMLGHLSKENNFPELAYKTVVENLIDKNIEQNIKLYIADRYNTSSIINIG